MDRSQNQLRQGIHITLTALNARKDSVEELRAGTDDHLVKPTATSCRQGSTWVSALSSSSPSCLDRVVELEASLAREKHLQGLLPICACCKKIRDVKDYWQQVEGYIEDHSAVPFSHGICPDCYVLIVPPTRPTRQRPG